MYEKNVVFPIEFKIKNLRTTIEENLDLTKAQKNRLNQLNELYKKHTVVVHHTTLIQQQCSKWHEQFIKKKEFHEGYLNFLYDSRFKRDFKGMLHTRWPGPYIINKVFDNGTICLTTIDENQTPLFVNGHLLQLYHKPISKDLFISHGVADPEFQLVQEHGFSLISEKF